MLAAVLDPAHRVSNLQRDRRDRDVLRHQAVLAAEAAADVGRDDADLVLGQPKDARQPDALHVPALGREINDELVHPVVPVGEHAAAFERHRRLPVHPEFPAHAHRRRCEHLRIAFDHGAGDVGVVGPVIEHARATLLHRRDAVDDRRELLHINAHLIGQIFGERASRRQAGGDTLPHIAHALVGERRIRAELVLRQLRSGFEDRQGTEIGEREDASFETLRLHDVAHAAVRDLAAHERDVLHAGHPQIGDVFAVAEEETLVLLARQARADPTVRRRM